MSDIDRTDRCWHCKGEGVCWDWCHVRTFPTEADLERQRQHGEIQHLRRARKSDEKDIAELLAERDRARRVAVELENQLAAVQGQAARWARREQLGVLLSRMQRGVLLVEERELLRAAVETELGDADRAHARAEQAEQRDEVLRIVSQSDTDGGTP